MRLSLTNWSFLRVVPSTVDEASKIDLIRVLLGPNLQIGENSYSFLNILKRGSECLVTAHGSGRPSNWALPAVYNRIVDSQAVVVFGQQALGISGLPTFRDGVLRILNTESIEGNPDLFKGLLKHSGILLSACLIAYSLSQVDWQNLTLPQSMASVALCGLGLDPSLATA